VYIHNEVFGFFKSGTKITNSNYLPKVFYIFIWSLFK
jgi:hypothetical protein